VAAILGGLGLSEQYSGGRSGPVPDGPVSGRARVIDGDSLRIGRHEIRLVGIDAPEGRQSCQRGGRTWACGQAAADRLRQLVRGRDVACAAEKRDQHNRLLATCRVAGQDINRAMIASGFAVAFGARYRSVEQQAKQQKAGLWSGSFQRPSDWRRQNL
ncbi:MAG: thermonuclease family protein, partial [Pseudomonadota bacterium]